MLPRSEIGFGCVGLIFVCSYVTEYVLQGHRVVHNNVILSLHRLLRFPPSDEGRPRSELISLDSLGLLDDSGAYMLQASIRLHDGGNPEIIALGVKELNALKAELKGVVELKLVDRLSLDTRAK